MGFRNHKEEAVYNWLTEEGSEKVAIFITNYFSADQVDEMYDELVAQDEIEDDETLELDIDDDEDEDEDDDEEMYNLQMEIAETMADDIGF